MKKPFCLLAAFIAIALLAAGCGSARIRNAGNADDKQRRPRIPGKLSTNDAGEPQLTVYDVDAGKTVRMGVEEYVMGVVAGEMKNDWPLEALKAQAILARTFVMKFCEDKVSKYGGADISTDVAEAQAYRPEDINYRVRQAVESTRGVVMTADGAFPYAWFHAHSGGMTELPSVALDYKGEDPAYLKPTPSEESDKAPESARHWEATFTRDEVAQACRKAGVEVGRVETVEIGEKGASGRAATLLVNGKSVSAPTLRVQIGANRMKSTLLESAEVAEDGVTFAGRGYGHGVGLSQWGAYRMAEEGSGAEQILSRYFAGVELVRLW